MRNNKGYTLVELLVAVALLVIVMAEVGALMFNSQSLYRNGFYEVNLQEESQQVIQQVEDLLMNATGWERDATTNRTDAIQVETKTYNGINSDIITIYTMVPHIPEGSTTGIPDGTYDKVKYRIGLAFDVNGGQLPGGDPIRPSSDFGTQDHMFETLVLERTQVAAGATTGTPTYATLAEGVRAIHLDYDTANDVIKGYVEADRVIFSVEMQNQKYSYSTDTASVSVYLRNQPQTADAKPSGSSGGPTGASNPDDKMIYILRVHDYDLHDYVSSYYDTFEFKNTSDTTIYTYNPANDHIQLNSTLWKNWSYQNVTSGGVDIYAYNYDDVVVKNIGKKIKITLYTEAVQYNDGLLYTYRNTNNDDGLLSVFPVKGICVCEDCVDKHMLEPQLFLAKVPNHATGSVIEFTSSSFELIDKSGTVKSQIAVPFTDGTTDEDGNLIEEGLCMSKGLTVSSRTDQAFSVKIPVGVGNLNYNWYSWNMGAGPRTYANGDPVMTHHTLHSDGDGMNLGNDITFNYTANIKNSNGNAIYLTTKQPFNNDKAIPYWQEIVEKGEGYIAVKMTLVWPSVTQAMVIKAYLYPECTDATKTQHDLILNRLGGTVGGTGTSYTPTAAPTLTGTPTTTPGTTPETTPGTTPETTPGTTPETTPETTPGTTTTTTPAAETLSGGGAVFNDYHMGNGACNITLTYSGEGTDTSARPVTVVVDFGTAIESSSDSDVTISGSQATVTKSIQYNKYTVGGISFAVKMPEGYSGTPIIVSVTPN